MQGLIIILKINSNFDSIFDTKTLKDSIKWNLMLGISEAYSHAGIQDPFVNVSKSFFVSSVW